MQKSTKITVSVIALILILLILFVLFFHKAEAPKNVSESKTYVDISSGISLQAPNGLNYQSSSNGLSLVFATTSPYAHTHLLQEIRIDIDLPSKECLESDGGPVSSTSTVVINGVSFERETWSGVGLGNLYQGIDYKTVRDDGYCYRVSFFTHSTNGEGFYTDNQAQIKTVDAQQAVDIKNLFALFDQIAGTIKFSSDKVKF